MAPVFERAKSAHVTYWGATVNGLEEAAAVYAGTAPEYAGIDQLAKYFTQAEIRTETRQGVPANSFMENLCANSGYIKYANVSPGVCIVTMFVSVGMTGSQMS
jgi:hypothetical protein